MSLNKRNTLININQQTCPLITSIFLLPTKQLLFPVEQLKQESKSKCYCCCSTSSQITSKIFSKSCTVQKVSKMPSSAPVVSVSRRKSFSMSIMYSALLASTLLLSLVTISECRSLRKEVKGKKVIFAEPEECGAMHCNGGSGCNTGEKCLEKIIYGDIIVCHCLQYKLADIPVIVDLPSNKFKK